MIILGTKFEGGLSSLGTPYVRRTYSLATIVRLCVVKPFLLMMVTSMHQRFIGLSFDGGGDFLLQAGHLHGHLVEWFHVAHAPTVTGFLFSLGGVCVILEENLVGDGEMAIDVRPKLHRDSAGDPRW